jgi:hypothetical protein
MCLCLATVELVESLSNSASDERRGKARQGKESGKRARQVESGKAQQLESAKASGK